MPFDRPALEEHARRIEGDLATRLGISAGLLRRTNTGVLARVLAAATFNLQGFLVWILQQIMPDTAEAVYLDRHAMLWGVTRKAAAEAAGNVTFTGNDDTVIPAGTVLQRSDGVEFTLDAPATIAAGTATGAVTAAAAGVDGNAAEGETLAFASPVAGASAEATVAAGGLTGGADTETDDALRARLLARIQAPPHGGTALDYVTWALEVAEVTRAWTFPLEQGLGTVTVRFVTDNAVGGLIPTAPKVTEVQDYIDARRPVTADVSVVAPAAAPLNFTIQLTPDTTAVRAEVEAELRDLLDREAAPGATILLSHINEAISIAAGETDHLLTVPAADVTHAASDIATFGAITWA